MINTIKYQFIIGNISGCYKAIVANPPLKSEYLSTKTPPKKEKKNVLKAEKWKHYIKLLRL